MRFALLFILCSSLVLAQGYYADVTLDVQADGSVQISGISNHPTLEPQVTNNLTSKTGAHWLFNLSIPDTFSDFVIAVRFPAGTSVNYVSAKSAVSIDSEGNQVVVKRIGSNSTINLAAQYQLSEQKSFTDALFTIVAIVATLLLFAGIMLIAYRRGAKRQVKSLPSYIDGLPSRQAEIVQLLHKAHGQLTQKQLETHMNIPKSSVSRNIDGLVRKGIVEKQSLGLTNIVKLK